MMEFFMEYKEMLLEGTYETLLMTFASTVFAYLIGLPLGVTMVITDAHGICPKKTLNTILATKGAAAIVRGTIAATGPIALPTINLVSGITATIRITKGIERPILMIVPKIVLRVL